MNHLSLFSGIGGLDLAAEWAGFRTVAFVERDPYCQRVLGKRWPGVPVIPDVRAVADAGHPFWREDAAQRGVPRQLRICAGWDEANSEPRATGEDGRVELVSGGFPCQPHSVAGKRQASADDRDLWPEVARVLREIRPRWFVGENVRGLLHSESGRFFGGILGDLADLGYSVGWGVWGASDVGALHQRERVFIVAHAPWDVQPEPAASRPERERARQRSESPLMADADDSRSQGHGGLRERADEWLAWQGDRPLEGVWESEPQLGRVAHGIPSRVDRLRALGNAVVPQQAYPLFRAIAEIEGMTEYVQYPLQEKA